MDCHDGKDDGFKGMEKNNMMQKQIVKSPCVTCSTEERDRCWKGSKFACERYYEWLNKNKRERSQS